MYRWYVINTYSGHENKVKHNLEHRVSRRLNPRRPRPPSPPGPDVLALTLPPIVAPPSSFIVLQPLHLGMSASRPRHRYVVVSSWPCRPACWSAPLAGDGVAGGGAVRAAVGHHQRPEAGEVLGRGVVARLAEQGAMMP